VRRRGKALDLPGLGDGQLRVEYGLDVEDQVGSSHGVITEWGPAGGGVNHAP
jgi:hypothetical protein